MSTAGVDEVRCPTCGQAFPHLGPSRDVRYRCLRCDALLVQDLGPTSSDSMPGPPARTVYAYARVTPSTPPPRLNPVRTVGRYQLRDEIGRGGMGVVYRAFDADLGREVALKVLLSGEHATGEHVDRFLREARAAAKVDHPNLVRVHDIGWADGRVYFTMELVEGPSLQQVLRRRSPLPAQEVARVGALLARALASAHDRGLVHRDVKPGNVLFRVDGTPLLADFGLATELADDRRLTRSGQLMGTPAYMAPEQTRGRLGPETDQYSLGAVLYEMASGHLPYEEVSAPEMVYAVVEGPPRPLSAIAPAMSRDLALIVETAMSREPGARYPSCLHLAEDLERWSRGEPILARPPSWWSRARALARRHRTFLGLAAMGLVAAASALEVGAAVRSSWERADASRRQADANDALTAVRTQVGQSLARGDEAGAEALLRAFTDRTDHHGTRAAAQAWGDLARLATVAGRSEEALDAWARSWVEARDPEEQDEALRGLEEEFHARWRWESLDRVLDRHLSTHPAAGADPVIASWLADAAFAIGDPGEAADALERAGRRGSAVARVFTRATRLSGDTPEPEGALVVGSDGPVWWSRRDADGALLRTRLVPGLPTDVVHHLPQDTWFQVAPGPEPVLVTWNADPTPTLRVHEPVDGAYVERYAFEDGAPMDLERLSDGSLRLAIGPYARHLVRLTRDADGAWHHDLPSPVVDAAVSDLVALEHADLDGDGQDELVVASGPWTAYDLRVWDGSPDGPDTRPLARRKLGHVSALSVVRGTPDRLWALHDLQYPSRVVFPADRPSGEDAGAWLLGLQQGRLETLRFLPSPGPEPASLRHLLVADLDGDGQDEVVYQHGHLDRWTLVVAPEGAEGPPLARRDLTPLFAAQLDEDPGLELVVRAHGPEPATWVVGLGDEPLPRADARPAPARAPTDPRGSWSRAEDLIAMGLDDAAIDELERLADTWRDRPEAIQVRRRIAELALRAGRVQLAAESLSRAAAVSHDPADHLAAARVWLGDLRQEEAQKVLSSVVDVSEEARELSATFEAELRATRTSTVDLAAGLPGSLGVREPGAVSVDRRAGGVLTRTSSGGPPVLELAAEVDGGRLGLSVDATVERMEWSAGVRVVATGPGGVGFELGATTLGGGGLLEREATCRVGDGHRARATAPITAAAAPTALAFEVELSEALGTWRCSVRLGDGPPSVTTGRLSAPLARGRWSIAVGPSSGLESPAQAVVLWRSLGLSGTVTPVDRDDPLRGFASGRLPEAPPPGLEVTFAAALADAGRTPEAVRLLRSVSPSEPNHRAHAVEAVRNRLPTFGPVLEEAWPGDWVSVFSDAWSVAMHSHPEDDEVRRALTTGLDGLDAALTGPATAARTRGATLLLARGRAWDGLRQPGAAARDLRRATDLLAPALAESEDRELRLALVTAWLDRADRAASSGDVAAAAAAIRELRSLAPSAELADDLLATRSTLTALPR